MEALAAWVEERKKYLLPGALAVAFSIFLFPHWHGIFGLVIQGLVLHLFIGEIASGFWLGMGYSPGVSQALAVAVGMVLAGGSCMIGFLLEGFFRKIFRLGKLHGWLVSHPRIKQLPYLGIVAVGLMPIPGGVITGIVIALTAQLPKLRATITILGTNFIKLCVLGKCVAFLFSFFTR